METIFTILLICGGGILILSALEAGIYFAKTRWINNTFKKGEFLKIVVGACGVIAFLDYAERNPNDDWLYDVINWPFENIWISIFLYIGYWIYRSTIFDLTEWLENRDWKKEHGETENRNKLKLNDLNHPYYDEVNNNWIRSGKKEFLYSFAQDKYVKKFKSKEFSPIYYTKKLIPLPTHEIKIEQRKSEDVQLILKTQTLAKKRRKEMKTKDIKWLENKYQYNYLLNEIVQRYEGDCDDDFNYVLFDHISLLESVNENTDFRIIKDAERSIDMFYDEYFRSVYKLGFIQKDKKIIKDIKDALSTIKQCHKSGITIEEYHKENSLVHEATLMLGPRKANIGNDNKTLFNQKIHHALKPHMRFDYDLNWCKLSNVNKYNLNYEQYHKLDFEQEWSDFDHTKFTYNSKTKLFDTTDDLDEGY